jgi:hypothetical protein
MSTSGSINFNMTARQVITDALRDINMLGETEDPSGDQADTAMRLLNRMLKDWQKYENLWRLTEGSVTLVNATASYVLTPFPHKVISARYRDPNSNDTALEELSRVEYYDMPNKSSAGRPNSYYVDYQRSAATMFLWSVPTAITTETVQYTFQRRFEDVDTLDDDIDVKQEHLDMVTLNLAARLADKSGRAGAHIDRIIARAHILLDGILDDDREGSIQMVPGRR